MITRRVAPILLALGLLATSGYAQRHPHSIVRTITTDYDYEFDTYNQIDIYEFTTADDTSQVLVDLYWNVNAVYFVDLSVRCYSEFSGEYVTWARSSGSGHLTGIRALVVPNLDCRVVMYFASGESRRFSYRMNLREASWTKPSLRRSSDSVSNMDETEWGWFREAAAAGARVVQPDEPADPREEW
ncbi:MAG: hypothetical protein OXG83_17035 [Acidobacteria bacterium]|nr:hypothetical protein [Acidobacteriota bacterium]